MPRRKSEYEIIINDIIKNKDYLKLKGDIHHGTDKFAHCSRVSYLAYKIAKQMKLDYKLAARSGMMHDFFYGTRNSDIANSYTNHPLVSAKNAKEFLNATDEEISIIKTHMFPNLFLNFINPFRSHKNKIYILEAMPNSKVGWIICLADTLVSLEEWSIYKVSFSISVALLFIFNMVTLNK